MNKIDEFEKLPDIDSLVRTIKNQDNETEWVRPFAAYGKHGGTGKASFIDQASSKKESK